MVADRSQETLHDLIMKNCERSSVIHTDGFLGYKGLDRYRAYPLKHRRFVHAEGSGEFRRAIRGEIRGL